jgi:hypothetical protein
MPIIIYILLTAGLTLSGVIPPVSRYGFAIPAAAHLLIFATTAIWLLLLRNQAVKRIEARTRPALEQFKLAQGDLDKIHQEIRPAEDRIFEAILLSDGPIDYLLSLAGDRLLKLASAREESPQTKKMREEITAALREILHIKSSFRLTLICCIFISLLALIINI